MNFNVIHHHIYHTNGFNPGNNTPPNIPTSDAWHLYHHAFNDPSFDPGARFNPFQKIGSWFKPAAPSYHYTFVYGPSMMLSQQINKAEWVSKDCLAQASQNREHVKPLNDDELTIIDDPQTVEECHTSENVVEELVSDTIAEDPQKILDGLVILIQEGKTALQTSFAELKQKNASSTIFKGILEERQTIWNDLEKQADQVTDFTEFKQEIEKQKQLDSTLAMILNEEVEVAENKKIPLKNILGFITSYQNQDIFSYRLAVAHEKANLPLLTETEEKEVHTPIMKILIELEKKENAKFIQSLSKLEDRFVMRGYTSVANHYQATIRRFKQMNDTLPYEDVDSYINSWNDLLKEFDPQHQLLLKLHDADVVLEEFGNTMHKQLDAIDEKRAGEIFLEINDMTEFMDRKATLKASFDVENYTRNIYEFIQKATMKLNNSIGSAAA